MFYRMLVNSLSLLGDAVWEDVCPEIGKDKDSASAYCCRLFLPSFLHSIYPTVHNNNWSISISVSVSSSSSNRYRFDRWSGSWIHPLMSDCEWSYWSCLLHEEKSLLVVERSRWIRAQVINRLLIQQYSPERNMHDNPFVHYCFHVLALFLSNQMHLFMNEIDRPNNTQRFDCLSRGFNRYCLVFCFSVL